jgi:hypothetical protein
LHIHPARRGSKEVNRHLAIADGDDGAAEAGPGVPGDEAERMGGRDARERMRRRKEGSPARCGGAGKG